jgi:hypothetical protein
MFPFVNPVKVMHLSIHAAMLMTEAQMMVAMRMMAMAGLWHRPKVAEAANTQSAPVPRVAPVPAPAVAPRVRAKRAAGRGPAVSN